MVNKHLAQICGELDEKTPPEIIVSAKKRRPFGSILDGGQTLTNGKHHLLKTFHPNDLINCTYLTAKDERGQQFCAKIVKKIINNDEQLEKHPE